MHPQQYADNERREFYAKFNEVEKQSLADRKEARQEYHEALKDPALVIERIGWLLDGNYGYGAQQEAIKAIKNKRLNRIAFLSITIAALEWSCPANFARDAYKKLTVMSKRRIDNAILTLINNYSESN